MGLESAKRLAAAGATVVLTSRDSLKGQKAVDDITSYAKENGVDSAKVMVANLDLCDLDNVKTFTGRLEKMIGDKKVDVLMNNAGVMAIPDKQLTKDGFEKTFQTNHLVSCHMCVHLPTYNCADSCFVGSLCIDSNHDASPCIQCSHRQRFIISVSICRKRFRTRQSKWREGVRTMVILWAFKTREYPVHQ